MPRARRRWTDSEDAILWTAVMKTKNKNTQTDWTSISQSLHQRTNRDCLKRWAKIDRRWTRGSWEDNEQDLLRKAVEEHGQRWKLVSDSVGTRSPEQCAKHWHNALDPNIDRTEWTNNDDALLLHAVSIHGHNWRHICDENFPRRSRLCLSNRYAMLQRKHAKYASSKREPPNPVPQRQDCQQNVVICSASQSSCDESNSSSCTSTTSEDRNLFRLNHGEFAPQYGIPTVESSDMKTNNNGGVMKMLDWENGLPRHQTMNMMQLSMAPSEDFTNSFCTGFQPSQDRDAAPMYLSRLPEHTTSWLNTNAHDIQSISAVQNGDFSHLTTYSSMSWSPLQGYCDMSQYSRSPTTESQWSDILSTSIPTSQKLTITIENLYSGQLPEILSGLRNTGSRVRIAIA